MNNKRIAIIEPTYITALGLKSLLDSMMPFAEIVIYGSFKDFNDDYISVQEKGIRYVHFFVSSKIIFEHSVFFSELPQITIVLTHGQSVNNDLLHARFLFLDINQSEPLLVKSILNLHGRGHQEPHKLSETASKENTVLSEREIEVLKLVAQGFMNKEIADKLSISTTTVISHRQNITEKLKLKSVAALTIYAVVNGYVDYSSVYTPR